MTLVPLFTKLIVEPSYGPRRTNAPLEELRTPARFAYIRAGAWNKGLGAKTMKQLASRLWREEARQDLNECPLLVTLIALSAISVIQSLAQMVSSVYGSAASKLSTT